MSSCIPPCFQNFTTVLLSILNRGCGTEDAMDRHYSRTREDIRLLRRDYHAS